MANEFKVKKGLIVDGSETVVDIQGTQGQLFSVTDSLTGDLFSVSDVSGIPILNINSSGAITFDGYVPDNNKLKFGNSGDLEIYHDGNHSRIKDAGQGHLTINATDFVVNNSTDTKNMIIATDGGSVNLYYNASQKFRTISAGAEVTGHLLPSADSTHDLGADATRWANVYADAVSSLGPVAIGGDLKINTDLAVLNKAQTAYIDLASRDISGSEVVYDLGLIGKVSVGGGDTSTAQMALKGQQSLLSFERGTSGDAKFFMSSDSARLYFSHTDIQSTNLILTLDEDKSATFAGDVTLSSTAPIFYLTNTTSTTGKNWRLSSAANGKMYIAEHGVIDAITLEHTSGNATFAGTLASKDLTVTSSGDSTYFGNFLASTGSAYAKFYQDSNNHVALYMAATGGTANIVLNSSGVSYIKGGNLIVGGSSDSGEKLQVEGTIASGNINISDGTPVLTLTDTSSSATATLTLDGVNLTLQNNGTDGDFTIIGKDGSSNINLLAFDTSEGGNATFAGNVNMADNTKLQIGADQNSNATGISLCAGASVGNLIARTTTHHNWFPYSDGNNYYSAGTHTFRSGSHGSSYLTLTSSLATFAGTVLIDGVSNYTGLEVKGVGGSRPEIKWSNANNGNLGNIYGTETNSLVIATGSSGTTALTLDSSQNATFSGDVILDSDSTKLKLGADQDAELYHNGSHLFIDNSKGTSYFRNTASDGSGILLRNSAIGDIQFDNEFAGNILFNTSNVERVRIDSSGKVGINMGGTSNSNKLTVVGDVLFSSDTASATSRSTNGVGINFTNNNTFSSNSDLSDGNRFLSITNDSTTANTYAPLSFRVNPNGGTANAMADIKLVANGSDHHLTTTMRNPATSTFLDVLSLKAEGGLDLQGSVGQLFSVTNSLSGDLFSVSDVSGIPILNVNSSGAVDIDGNLDINGTLTINNNVTLQDGDYLRLGTAQDLQIYHNGSHSFIDEVGTGSLYIRTNGAAIYFQDTSNNAMAQFTDGGGCFLSHNASLKLSTTSSGVSVTGSMTASADVVAYSDERLKTNIKTLDGSKVYEMRGVSFTKDDKEGSGVIAQELEKIAPELVNNDNEYKAVAYGNITGYLIEAIKDLKAEIEELKKQIK